MTGLIDGLMEQLGSSGTSQLAGVLGADENAMGGLISAALPAILGGLAKNAEQADGASSLASALDDHDDSIFGNLGSLLGGGGPGDAILGHVLGQKRPQVEQQVAGNAGVDLSMITKLLPLLAPLVMGYLSKQKKTNNLDEAGLGAMLNNERKAVEAKQPGLGGLASILDADGDGSVLDDVMNMATGGGGGSSKGGLGGLLGKLLRR
ncbi:MAG: hypothetical protein ACI8TP_002382 [Acidimicrobiales bacterium]|jgi:hypothetical protein